VASGDDATGKKGRRKAVRTFDFRRPNKLNRDHVRTLEIVQETFARQFTTDLSSSLRAVSTVSLESAMKWNETPISLSLGSGMIRWSSASRTRSHVSTVLADDKVIAVLVQPSASEPGMLLQLDPATGNIIRTVMIVVPQVRPLRHDQEDSPERFTTKHIEYLPNQLTSAEGRFEVTGDGGRKLVMEAGDLE
jgi:hypothetical protein